ncbi:hypothetical protein ACWEVP_18870 [Amycolatopsis sp. NPDC003865]
MGGVALLVIVVSAIFGAHLFGEEQEPVLLLLLASTGASAGLSMSGPLIVLNLRFRRFRLGIEAVGDI